MHAVLDPLMGGDMPVNPPDMIGDYPALLLYPQPGSWAFLAQSGQGERPLFGGDHVFVIEYHLVNADLSEAVRLTTPMADAIPTALFSAFDGDRIAGTLTVLKTIRCESFGELMWGSDKTFGVRFLVDVTIFDEVPA